MALSTTDKLNLALELLPDRDIEIYRATCRIDSRFLSRGKVAALWGSFLSQCI